MSAHVVLSCDGHRHGQPCRGALHTRALTTWSARLVEAPAWRSVNVGGQDLSTVRFIDLCPSGGHDEDRP